MTWKQAAQKAQRDKVKPIPAGWFTSEMIAKEIGATSGRSHRVRNLIASVKPKRKLWLIEDATGRPNATPIYKLPE